MFSSIVLFCTIPVKVKKDATIIELEKAIRKDFKHVAHNSFMQWKVDKDILQLDFKDESVAKVFTKEIRNFNADESFDYMNLVIEPPEFTGKSQEVLKFEEPLKVILHHRPNFVEGFRSLISPFVCKFTQDGQNC